MGKSNEIRLKLGDEAQCLHWGRSIRQTAIRSTIGLATEVLKIHCFQGALNQWIEAVHALLNECVSSLRAQRRTCDESRDGFIVLKS